LTCLAVQLEICEKPGPRLNKERLNRILKIFLNQLIIFILNTNSQSLIKV